MTTPLDTILSGQGTPAPEKETTQVTQPETGTQPEAGSEPEAPSEGGKSVPIEALHAERQKTKRYTEQIADFDRKLTESNTAWERRINQLMERVAPQPEKPDFFVDPDAAVRAAIGPVVQQISSMSLWCGAVL